MSNVSDGGRWRPGNRTILLLGLALLWLPTWLPLLLETTNIQIAAITAGLLGAIIAAIAWSRLKEELRAGPVPWAHGAVAVALMTIAMLVLVAGSLARVSWLASAGAGALAIAFLTRFAIRWLKRSGSSEIQDESSGG